MNYFATHRDAAEQREEILIKKKKSLATSVSGARAHEKGKRGKTTKYYVMQLVMENSPCPDSMQKL